MLAVRQLLAWDWPLSVVCVACETPLEKASFSFGSNYQSKIASDQGMRTRIHSPSLSWDPTWPRPVQALSMLLQSLWIHMCVGSTVSWRPYFLCAFHSTGSYNLSPPSSAEFSESEGKGLMATSHLEVSVPWFHMFWMLSGCESLHLFPSLAGGSFSGDGWSWNWSISIRECSQEFIGMVL